MAKKKAEEAEIKTAENMVEKEPMKTLMNCTSTEFLKQANLIKYDVAEFVRATKINDILREGLKLSDDMSDEEKAAAEKKHLGDKWDKIFKVCFVENSEITMKVISGACFTTVDKLEELSPTEITSLAILLLGSQRVNDFFMALKVWGLFDTES